MDERKLSHEQAELIDKAKSHAEDMYYDLLLLQCAVEQASQLHEKLHKMATEIAGMHFSLSIIKAEGS